MGSPRAVSGWCWRRGSEAGREPLGPGFRREVEAYLEVTRTKPYLFGRMAMSNPTFLSELRRGVDMNLDTVGKVRRWMDGNSSAAERERIRALARKGTEETDRGDRGVAAGYGDWMEMAEVASLLGFSARTLPLPGRGRRAAVPSHRCPGEVPPGRRHGVDRGRR